MKHRISFFALALACCLFSGFDLKANGTEPLPVSSEIVAPSDALAKSSFIRIHTRLHDAPTDQVVSIRGLCRRISAQNTLRRRGLCR